MTKFAGNSAAVNNIASAKISGQKVNWASVAIDAFAGAASLLVGSAATKKLRQLQKNKYNEGCVVALLQKQGMIVVPVFGKVRRNVE